MPPDDDADDEGAGVGPPLPPDDRLWRHPSEVARHGPPAGGAVAPAPVVVGGPTWPIALLAGAVGAVLALSVLVATGGFTHEVEKPVVQKVAVIPVVSSPMVRGERGVAAVVAQVAPTVAVVSLRRTEGTVTGTGVIFRDDGLLLTSANLVGGAATVDVTLNGHRYAGEVIGVDESTDVAVVDIKDEGLPVAVLGRSSGLEVGTPVIAITMAPSGGTPTVATGVVSAIGRRVETIAGTLHGMIQTDAPVEALAAGGPVVDASGAVVGITGPAPTQATGYGFAVPIDLARRIVDELLDSGHVSHPWLGIEGHDLTDSEAVAMGVGGGARIDAIAPASPADAAGLQEDDVITEVDGRHVDSTSDLVLAVRAHQPGDEIVVGYWHDGTHRRSNVTVGDKPSG